MLKAVLEDYRGAILDWSHAIRLEHDPRLSQELRGDAFMQMRNYPRALNDYREALQGYSRKKQDEKERERLEFNIRRALDRHPGRVPGLIEP